MSTHLPPPPPPESLLPWLERGTRVGLYQVDQLISSGGFGAVYRVSRDGQPFALKLPVPTLDSLSPEERGAVEQRIVREVVALMTVQHPSIVRVRGFDRWPDPTDGALYLVMDFVDGRPLLRWRREVKPSLRELVELFRTLALAIDEMHRLGVVHRDIKSANVLVSREAASKWRPVLVDFGLARPACTPDVTREYVMVGTEGHWAPEHVAFTGTDAFERGERFQFTPATDLHALGHLFYEALTGRPPFRRRSTGALLTAIAGERPPAPSSVANELPAELDPPVLHLLAKRPEERTPSGKTLADELDGLLARAGERWDVPLEPHSAGGPDAATTPARAERTARPMLPTSLPTDAPGSAALPMPANTAEVSIEVAGPRAARPSLDSVPPGKTKEPELSHLAKRFAPKAHASPHWLLPIVAVVLGCGVIGACLAAIVLALGGNTAFSLAWREAPAAQNSPAQEAPAARAEAAAPSVALRSEATVAPHLPITPAPAPSVSNTITASSRQVRPTRPATEPTPSTQPKQSPVLARAAIVGHVQSGSFEAVLTRSLELSGAPRLDAGSTLTGVAREADNGDFELEFHQARRQDGTALSVEGHAALDAGAGVRRPLRAGARPERIEFDVALTRRP